MTVNIAYWSGCPKIQFEQVDAHPRIPEILLTAVCEHPKNDTGKYISLCYSNALSKKAP